MKLSLLSLILVVTCAAVGAIAETQPTFRLAGERTVRGMIEMTAAADRNMVFVSIDMPNNQGQYDGNIEAVYMIELQTGVPKPAGAKVLGTLAYKANESLSLDAGKHKWLFSRVLGATAKGPEEMWIVDLREWRRSQSAPDKMTHEFALTLFKDVKRIVPKPPGV